MKVSIVQVPYPHLGEAEKTLQWQIDLLNNWSDSSTDLIFFPENANCTGYVDKANMLELIRNQGRIFEQAAQNAARRINCTVVSGLMTIDENNTLRNQLAFFPPDGEMFTPYTKVHLVEPEIAKGIVAGNGAAAFEYNGVRFGAAICFDYYFPELFAEYARQRIDVMLIASHQRQERPEILEFVTRARAFDLGCTLLRAAPAMYTPDVGGRSMAVAPDGTVIADAGGAAGVLTCEIDPKQRFTRPASFGEPDKIIDYREALLLSRSHVDK